MPGSRVGIIASIQEHPGRMTLRYSVSPFLEASFCDTPSLRTGPTDYPVQIPLPRSDEKMTLQKEGHFSWLRRPDYSFDPGTTVFLQGLVVLGLII